MSRKQSGWSVWVIPIIDVLLTAAAFGLYRSYVFEHSAARALARLEPAQAERAGDLERRRSGLEQLSKALDEGPLEIPPALPSGGAGRGGLLSRLDRVGAAASDQQARACTIDGIEAAAAERVLTRSAVEQREYWQRQMTPLDKPCLESEVELPVPELVEERSLADRMTNVKRVHEYGKQVAERLEDCTATIPVSLTEDDLRFAFNSDNDLDMTKQQQATAFKTIRAKVQSHPEHRVIYIAGYTDFIGSDADNYRLSQGRAEYVARIIREYLDSQKQREGIDYHVYIERRGEVECPEQRYARGGVEDEAYRRSCRRIELKFQRSPQLAAKRDARARDVRSEAK